jgi:hypothetical protein
MFKNKMFHIHSNAVKCSSDNKYATFAKFNFLEVGRTESHGVVVGTPDPYQEDPRFELVMLLPSMFSFDHL